MILYYIILINTLNLDKTPANDLILLGHLINDLHPFHLFNYHLNLYYFILFLYF
jgi:hypothetical protein